MTTVLPRSWLFVPGDSERKFIKAMGGDADAIIIDLEDSVADTNKPLARRMAAAALTAHPRSERRAALWVRVNPLDSAHCAQDVAVIAALEPDGLMLPKAEGPDDIVALAAMIDTALSAAGRTDPAIAIVPVASETPRAVFKLAGFADSCPARLAGITWGAEDLAAAIGASGNRHADGRFHDAFRVTRSLALLAAHAAGVQAIDTLHADFRDDEGLRLSSESARREGFSGRLAIHPAQVPIINAAFAPTAGEIAFAEQIVAAFATAGDIGAVGIDGKMIDRPHLLQAEALLARRR